VTPKRITLLLGKIGDIFSLLPLLYEELLEEDPQLLMVSKKYADVLEGCTYIKPIIFDGEMWELDKAYAEAERICSNVRCVQLAGPVDLVRRFTYNPAGLTRSVTTRFELEQWKVAGKMALWNKQTPLLFDNRNKEREQALIDKWLFPPSRGKNLKTILVSTAGETSPFPYKKTLMALLSLKFSKHRIIDLDQIKAERIYDLLGLYEKADCLVAADSAPLHLAHAAPTLPVVALINDKPSLWHGSSWRANHIRYIRYSDFAARAHEILTAIEGIPYPAAKTAPVVIHTFSTYEESTDDECAKAAVTWKRDNVFQTPIELGMVGRDSRMIMKDPKRVPFVKDVIRLATYRARPNDMVCLTRADTHWALNAAPVFDSKPVYAHRLIRDKDGDTWHPAVDLVAFTRQWWEDHNHEYPADMLLGYDPHWHRVLMELVKKHGGQNRTGIVFKEPSPLRKMDGAVYLVQNERIAKDWFKKNQIGDLFPAVSKQLKATTVNRRALFTFGYNPSIIHWKGKYLLTYRYHPENRFSTRLAIAELDADFNVTHNEEIQGLEGVSVEDSKLFIHRGRLCMSWINAVWPAEKPTCSVRYGVLEKRDKWMVTDKFWPKYGKNDGSGTEKNWVFFGHEKLYCIYKSDPEQVVVHFDNGEAVDEFHSDAPRWNYGPIKGGTTPIPYQGRLLRLFHSTLDNEPVPYRRRYYIGALLMDSTPPFAVHKVSSEPIMYGSEHDDLTDTERSACGHYKPKVVFPSGAVDKDDDTFLLAFGINDSSCGLATITEKDLKL
jgi:hypothetical protein